MSPFRQWGNEKYVRILMGFYMPKNKTEVCILELWQCALNNPVTKPAKKDSNEIALILQATGEWERMNSEKRFQNFGMQKGWKRKNCVNGFIPTKEKTPFDN